MRQRTIVNGKKPRFGTLWRKTPRKYHQRTGDNRKRERARKRCGAQNEITQVYNTLCQKDHHDDLCKVKKQQYDKHG
jgi:hypothetical protein